MSIRFVTIAALAMLGFMIPVHAAQTLVWETEEFGFVYNSGPSEECKPNDQECLQADHVSYSGRSKFGRTVYLTYEEASRVYLSFDASLEQNPDVQTVFKLEMLTPGPFDWGGVMRDGTFVPLYVVKRIYDPYFDYSTDEVDTTKFGLYVWRLSTISGESSTLLNYAGSENAKARALVEADFARQR